MVYSIYLWLTLVIYIHYGYKLGVLSAEAVVPMYLICTVGVLCASPGAYYVRKVIDK